MENIYNKFFSGDGISSLMVNLRPNNNLNKLQTPKFNNSISNRYPSAINRSSPMNYSTSPLIAQEKFSNDPAGALNSNVYSQFQGFNNLSQTYPRSMNNYYKGGEYRQILEDNEINGKKYASKVQMMEEKMKNLELKSQRLEVINDFFFDMFENNLVKDQLLKQQKENMKQNSEENEESDSGSEEDYKRSKKRGKRYKESNESSNPILDFEPKEFQQQTLKNATKILKLIKKEIGDYVLEDQLKKNEEIQAMNEEILDLKHDLYNRLLRLKQRQKNQMETLSFILKNSDNQKIEGLAKRLIGNSGNGIPNDTNATKKNYFPNVRSGDNTLGQGMLGSSNIDSQKFRKHNSMAKMGKSPNYETGNLKEINEQNE